MSRLRLVGLGFRIRVIVSYSCTCSCTIAGDGQTSCKVWLASCERHRCSNEAKTQNPLKFAGVPQTPEPILAVNGPKFAILWEHLEKILLFNIFPIVDTCLSCEDIARQSCAMVRRWRFCILYFQRVACSTFHTYILNLH